MNTVTAAPGSPAPPSILVVEDEAVVAMDLRSQLEDMCYRVCAIADNAREAISLAHKERPGLVLMDIVIKGAMDGIEAAAQIGRSLHIPVIFLTAYSDESMVERAARTNAYGYLTKPFQAKELRAAIEVALHKALLERQLRESEQWFAATLRCVGDGVVATRSDGVVRFMNPVAEALLSCGDGQGLDRDIGELMQLRDRLTGAPLESPVHRALRGQTVVGIDFGSMLLACDGTQVPIDDSASPIRGDDGVALGAVVVFRDVRERLAAEAKLRQSEERFRNAFHFAPVGMALVGLDHRFLQVNGALSTILGRSEAELLGVNQDTLGPPSELGPERERLNQLLSGHAEATQFEKRYRNIDGGYIWTLASVSLLRQDGEPLCYLWQVHDLTERKNAEYRLARMAYFDPLTGLANRAWLSEEIERKIVQARRRHHCFAVVFLDLDHFKQINDSLGHEAGDEMLQAVAAKLTGALRETDAVARLGGDEFVMLLPEIRAAEDVLAVTDKVQQECTRAVRIAGHDISISVSMGVSLFPDDAQDARTLLRYADSALYHAKSDGRNTLKFYRPELTARAVRRMQLGAGLHTAVQRHEFELFYQPVVSLAGDLVSSAEALVRWHHPSLGLLMPSQFIALAEESGMAVPLGDWVLQEACRQAAGWDACGVAVNVSPRQFKRGNLLDTVRRALAAAALPPQCLCIEITEDLLLENSEENLETIAALREMGVTIAIDDFGVGYSSLSYIRRFRPEKMKIDCSLIRNVATDSGDAELVRAAISMAHALKVSVVAEGVETEAQRLFLDGEGCDMVQGFLYAKAQPASVFEAWRADYGSSRHPAR
ncbi:two-component system response regulator [Noviherbaspirillum suwonense]|uniref:PAS domain S-box-containing protein/diguanylate cyclase (GGDEF) domain-containing protein n=1 Tax=Noviherbaspirillum suwonense TaxID=1224511 RepID=A0ABY1QSV1_9BURK|nr:EAL domain-containing protein [Noviherbaspirillum suwonense]SMP79722.1 PAS domain S-box-containing protein/diguanylate cyclase (GGDEF) domain-containing protein [Noviherbaspirillum suwonense]